ncbi:hypothetical protein M5689_024212 [Euphorbia peplus]|nr:hypothetical protein M5689_024212 [Euphorbia peplus]
MGCCISRFRPTRHSIIQQSKVVVQDNLVISQNVPKTPISSSNKISPSPLSPTSSSVSSFFDTHSNSISSSSSVSAVSASSSILSAKDRSFSNEFLWSCVKENPHIIHINSIKEASNHLHNVVAPKPNLKQTGPQLKQPIPPRLNSSPKRIRSNSPSRQKSCFREELNRVDSFYYSRSLKSPSPSRRFNADYSRKTPTKRMANSTKLNQGNESVICSPRKEKLNSSGHHHHHLHPCLRKVNRETCIHRINSRIDEVAAEEAVADHDDIDSVPPEDIDNPHISLDCFIFL